MRFTLSFVFWILGMGFAYSDDEFREFKGHTGPTRIGLFTPDNKLLVTTSGWPGGDGTVRVFDLKTAKELRKIDAHKQNVNCMAMSPDGKFVVSGAGNEEGLAHVWEVETGKKITSFTGHGKGQNISSIVFSNDGKIVASGSQKKLLLWDPKTGKEIRKLEGHEDLVRCVEFTADNKTLCSGSWDGSIKVWDVEKGTVKLSFKPKTKWVQGLAILPDSKRIVIASDEFSLWNIETGQREKKYQGNATCVAVSSDGKLLLSGFYDGKVQLRRTESGQVLGEYQAHIGHIHGLAFSKDKKWFSTAGGGDYKNNKEIKGEDFMVRVWPVEEE